MRWQRLLSTMRLRLRSLFRRSQADQELRDELQDHLDRQIEFILEALPKLPGFGLAFASAHGVNCRE